GSRCLTVHAATNARDGHAALQEQARWRRRRRTGSNRAMNEQETANLEFVLEYLDRFGTFDPEQYDPYLAENPTYMAGMNIRQGREAFHANTSAGKILYPRPEEATREILATLATGDWVSLLFFR